MPIPEYKPHALAIYWNLESQNFQEGIPQEEWEGYWERFLQSIPELYPQGKIYTNYGKNRTSQIQIKYPQYDWQELDAEQEWEFFSKLLPELPPLSIGNEDWDEVCFLYFQGIPPLLDPKLSQELWKRHVRYFSQYSYSENLPPGIVPFVLTREFLKTLPPRWEGTSHDYFLKNINNYDVEIFFQNPDLRYYRLNFYPNDPRSKHLIDGIQKLFNSKNHSKNNDSAQREANPFFQYENLQETIHQNPQLLRPSPSWIELEVYRGCELKCIFCPRQYIDNTLDGTYLTKKDIDKIVQEKNELPGRVTYCLGGMGEPFLHPDLGTVLQSLLQSKELEEIIIETALYVDEKTIQNTFQGFQEDEKKKVNFILNLTTLQETKYQELYGRKDLQKVLNNLKLLSSLFPKKQISVQILKIQEVEEEVEKYFNYFEKEGYPIIFQKYNRFAGLMPERRVSNLVPIKREFCWHLARDLYIRANGDVLICRQISGKPLDINKTTHPTEPTLLQGKEPGMVLGNIQKDSLQKLWELGNAYLQNSFLQNHESIPAPCVNCDEWYTFNA